jgi:hypothetical protein
MAHDFRLVEQIGRRDDILAESFKSAFRVGPSRFDQLVSASPIRSIWTAGLSGWLQTAAFQAASCHAMRANRCVVVAAGCRRRRAAGAGIDAEGIGGAAQGGAANGACAAASAARSGVGQRGDGEGEFSRVRRVKWQ